VGSKLTILAAVVASVAAVGTAHADAAGDALKKGIDLYKAGKYAEAIPYLEKAHKLDGKPDTLFALAQAQRLGGDCGSAAPNYRKVIEQVSDMNVAKLVQQNLSICEPDEPRKLEPKAEKRDEPAPQPEAAKPEVVERTVVREVGHTDKLAAAMFGGGMLAVGVAGGLYIAASNNADAADRAKSLEDHDLLADRATSQRTIMYVAGGVGVAMMGFAIYRWTTGGDKSKADVALVPTSAGGQFVVSGRF
jgi:tetratricopeptide (TPR) repeat protein